MECLPSDYNELLLFSYSILWILNHNTLIKGTDIIVLIIEKKLNRKLCKHFRVKNKTFKSLKSPYTTIKCYWKSNEMVVVGIIRKNKKVDKTMLLSLKPDNSHC